jgi:hypothetical protein
MIVGQQQLDTGIHFLMPPEVRNLHYIKQCGLCEVHGPLLRDNLQIVSHGDS